MTPDPDTLPLFPLNAVVFPGGRMKLRIFEPRYVDMVSHCMREGSGFGICPIAEGSETGAPADIFTIGTRVYIVDFEKLEDGLLGITVEGRERFEVCESWANPDQLQMAEVAWLPEPIPSELQPRHEPLALLLRQVFAEVQVECGYGEPEYANAAWVLGRLVELLPLAMAFKARMLELDDLEVALDELLQALESMATRAF